MDQVAKIKQSFKQFVGLFYPQNMQEWWNIKINLAPSQVGSTAVEITG